MNDTEGVMLDSDGKLFTAADTRLAVIEAAKGPALPAASCPDGHVVRNFNFRDRDLIFQAIRAYAAGEKRGDYKSMQKIHRIETVLASDECGDFFDALQEKDAVEVKAWAKLKEAHVTNKASDPGPRPEPSEEAARGETVKFYVKSTLDTWIIEAVKDMKWNPLLAEYVCELCDKLGLKAEE
jgi:hypothetical protein